LMRVSKFDLK